MSVEDDIRTLLGSLGIGHVDVKVTGQRITATLSNSSADTWTCIGVTARGEGDKTAERKAVAAALRIVRDYHKREMVNHKRLRSAAECALIASARMAQAIASVSLKQYAVRAARPAARKARR